jgi:glycosyltransferase involved in cell wall biosynthesis
MERKTRVCYVLSYKSPNYVRTTRLVEALKLLKEVKLYQARNKRKGIVRYFETFFKFLEIRIKYNPDIYIIGFRGHEIYWLVRIFALRKKFIFDEMMSPYDSLVSEKKLFKKSSLLMRIIYLIERSILMDADCVLTDTNLHVEFLSKIFNIRQEKIFAVPVGTDKELFDIDNTEAKDFGRTFTIFFYGSFLPLHGLDVILDAAKSLEDLPIKFVIVGGRGKRKALREFKEKMGDLGLQNVEYHKWLDFEELPKYIKGADLCLGGPFGGTPQAKRVVNGKTYQFLAMGKPTVIGKIDEDFGFIDKKNCLLVEQADYNSLKEKLLWCYENKGLLEEIGLRGRKLFKENYSAPVLARGYLSKIFERIE